MSFQKFTAIFAAVGLLVPFVFLVIGYFINQSANLSAGLIADKLALLLWPTSLMTLPASTESGFETKLFLFSLAANVIFYTIIGMLIWFGLRKNVGFFAIAGIPLVTIWWWLLTR